MNARARVIAAALAQLRAALPGCESVCIRSRHSEPGITLHLEAVDDASTRALAEAMGLERLEVSRSASSAWLSGSSEDAELYVLVTGPMHRSPPPVLDADLEAACAAVSTAGGGTP